MEEPHAEHKTATSRNVKTFATVSAIGAFLFLIPIPNGQTFTVPIGIVINFVKDLLIVNDFNIARFLVLVFISCSCLLTLVGYIFKPKFIMENEKLKRISLVSSTYVVSKFIGLAIVIMSYFKVGSAMIYSGNVGGTMLGLCSDLISIVLVIGIGMTLLTDFGLMEFVGVLTKKIVRPLFTCSGRSAVDALASWFGAASSAVILTNNQYESGFYTGREAAVIATNFSLVSLPFCFAISKLIRVDEKFTVWYMTICAVGFLLALITPRIWPLKNLPNTYDEIAGKNIEENIPEGLTKMGFALDLASKRAKESSFKSVVKSGLSVYLDLFIDFMPIIMAWGTLALIVVTYTPIFNYISIPFGYYMQLLGIEDAMKAAPISVIGFVDMYLPAIMISNDSLQEKTRFILGALSIIQIIYMTEVGILIAKSKIPIDVFKLFVVFLERTLIGLPLLTLFANFIY